MPAYIIAIVNVTDAQAFEQARRAAGSATFRYGAKFLGRGSKHVSGGEVSVIEGDLHPDHMTIIEYPSMEAAQQWLASPEYRATRDARAGAAQFKMFLVPSIEQN